MEYQVKFERSNASQLSLDCFDEKSLHVLPIPNFLINDPESGSEESTPDTSDGSITLFEPVEHQFSQTDHDNTSDKPAGPRNNLEEIAPDSPAKDPAHYQFNGLAPCSLEFIKSSTNVSSSTVKKLLDNQATLISEVYEAWKMKFPTPRQDSF